MDTTIDACLTADDLDPTKTTEVLGRESVVVTATMKSSANAEVTRSTEEWSFVKADCAR